MTTTDQIAAGGLPCLVGDEGAAPDGATARRGESAGPAIPRSLPVPPLEVSSTPGPARMQHDAP